jgi:hypothetical protein
LCSNFKFLNSNENIVNSLDHRREEIYSAMEEYHRRTCVRFEPRRNSDRNWVYIYFGNVGCFSIIGCAGGGQDLSLGNGCWDYGTIVHELGKLRSI